MTDGFCVYLTSVMLHRSRLPGGVLNTSVLPVAVAPGRPSACMLLPLPCWPTATRSDASILDRNLPRNEDLARRPVSPEQLAEDDRDARENPHRTTRADDLVPGASAQIATLTPACAGHLRTLAGKNNMGNDWYVRVGGDGNVWTLDLSRGPVASGDEVVRSEGVRIAFPRRMAAKLRGVVIEYRRTPIGDGFQFIEP